MNKRQFSHIPNGQNIIGQNTLSLEDFLICIVLKCDLKEYSWWVFHGHIVDGQWVVSTKQVYGVSV